MEQPKEAPIAEERAKKKYHRAWHARTRDPRQLKQFKRSRTSWEPPKPTGNWSRRRPPKFQEGETTAWRPGQL